MTDAPETDYIELVDRFTSQLLDRLRKLKAAPDKPALRQLIFLSLLSSETYLTPTIYESDDEDAKPLPESTDARVNHTLDIIVYELDRLRETRERLDANLDNDSDESDEQHPYMEEEATDEARLDHYRVLLDQAYAFVEHVLREAMTNRDGFIAQDANEAIAGIVALRASIDSFDDGYLPEEDVQ